VLINPACHWHARFLHILRDTLPSSLASNWLKLLPCPAKACLLRARHMSVSPIPTGAAEYVFENDALRSRTPRRHRRAPAAAEPSAAAEHLVQNDAPRSRSPRRHRTEQGGATEPPAEEALPSYEAVQTLGSQGDTATDLASKKSKQALTRFHDALSGTDAPNGRALRKLLDEMTKDPFFDQPKARTRSLHGNILTFEDFCIYHEMDGDRFKHALDAIMDLQTTGDLENNNWMSVRDIGEGSPVRSVDYLLGSSHLMDLWVFVSMFLARHTAYPMPACMRPVRS